MVLVDNVLVSGTAHVDVVAGWPQQLPSVVERVWSRASVSLPADHVGMATRDINTTVFNIGTDQGNTL